MKNIDSLKKQKWYFGNFYLDCSNLDDNSLNANIISIPYCEIDGKYYTIIDLENGELIELPLRISDDYPFNTGLKPRNSIFYFSVIELFLPRFDLKNQVETICLSRNCKNEEEIKLRENKHKKWLPNCLMDDKNGMDSSDYKWYFEKYTIVDKDENGDLVIKTIDVPVAVNIFDDYIIYTDIWKRRKLPLKTKEDVLGLSKPNFINLGKKGNLITPKEAHRWYLENANYLRDMTYRINFIKKNNLNLDSYKTVMFIMTYIDYALERKIDLDEVLEVLRSQINLNKDARRIIQDYLFLKFGNRIREVHPDLTENELKEYATIPHISTDLARKGIDKVTTYGNRFTLLSTKECTDMNTYISAIGDWYDITGSPFYFIYGGNNSQKYLNAVRNNYFEKGKAFLATILNNLSNQIGNGYSVKLCSDVIMTWEQSLLLNMKYLDIIDSLAKKMPVKIKYVLVISGKEGPEAKFGEICINSIDDLNKINLKHPENYYTIKEYPMDNIRLTTRIKTSEEMLETKKQIKFLFK